MTKPYRKSFLLALRIVVLLAFNLTAHADQSYYQFKKLPVSADAEAAEYAPVFDFTDNGCLPSVAVNPAGIVNPGLDTTGSIGGECRNDNFLDASNTYHRKQCLVYKGTTYCVHMYWLYFQKDQGGGTGHRHDIEYVLVWLNGPDMDHLTMTDVSVSKHHGGATEGASKHIFDKDTHLRAGYTIDTTAGNIPLAGATHYMTFGSNNEAHNPYKAWVTPDIVDWYTMQGDSTIDNAALRKIFNSNPFGDATCSFNDTYFMKRIVERRPNAYPSDGAWETAVNYSIANNNPVYIAP